jgi:two-component system, chemotaxis family, protein-glutamate methylesterase/glutaminase
MPPIRVFIVDDSSVIRKILREALASDPVLEVAGIAPDGETAITRIEQVHPDIVTLDVELPGMSGLETLQEIHKRWPSIPVIMFSTLTEKGAVTTLDALSRGASDYVTKPSNSGSVEDTKQRICAELIPKLKALSQGRKPATIAPSGLGSSKKSQSFLSPRIDIVALGTSTGGPNALGEVLPRLPAGLRVPIVLVQHMPALFTRYLADRLAKTSALKVAEGVEGQEVHAGEVWIAPGDYHMTVEKAGPRMRLKMNQDPQENSCRPAVDVLFRSVADSFGAGVLGVVLTGMGSDGVRGSERILAAGGRVIVQDEASSVVWGMPGQVAAAGYAHGIYPLSEIAKEIERRVDESHRGLKAGGPVPVVAQSH